MYFELIEKRRSIRRYAETPIPKDKIDRLKEAVLRAPSSRGVNPWEFVFVTDRDLLSALARAKPHGSSFLAGAPLGVVVCADPSKSDVWVEDASIATIFIQLAAEALGLGSCWIQIRERMHTEDKSAADFIADRLHLPGHLAVEAMVAVGFPAEQKTPHPKDSLQFEKIFLNRYGNPDR